jgi:hypothetical protein
MHILNTHVLKGETDLTFTNKLYYSPALAWQPEDVIQIRGMIRFSSEISRLPTCLVNGGVALLLPLPLQHPA